MALGVRHRGMSPRASFPNGHAEPRRPTDPPPLPQGGIPRLNRCGAERRLTSIKARQLVMTALILGEVGAPLLLPKSFPTVPFWSGLTVR